MAENIFLLGVALSVSAWLIGSRRVGKGVIHRRGKIGDSMVVFICVIEGLQLVLYIKSIQVYYSFVRYSMSAFQVLPQSRPSATTLIVEQTLCIYLITVNRVNYVVSH